jgi:hypothetical protein
MKPTEAETRRMFNILNYVNEIVEHIENYKGKNKDHEAMKALMSIRGYIKGTMITADMIEFKAFKLEAK